VPQKNRADDLGNLEHNTLRYIMPPTADYAGALHKTCAAMLTVAVEVYLLSKIPCMVNPVRANSAGGLVPNSI
jgi:hypothetical protein